MDYERVFKIFQRCKVKYLIAGGIAVNLYGVPRFTKDLDILVETSAENLMFLKKAIQKLGFRPRMPVSLDEFLNPSNWKKWYREKGCLALNLFNPRDPYEGIDILAHTRVTFKSAHLHHQTVSLGPLKLHLVSIDDLIKMKKDANRAQDQADIISLKKVKRLRLRKRKK